MGCTPSQDREFWHRRCRDEGLQTSHAEGEAVVVQLVQSGAQERGRVQEWAINTLLYQYQHLLNI